MTKMETFITMNFWVIALCILLALIDARLAASYVAVIIVMGTDSASNGWLLLAIICVMWCLDTRQQRFLNKLSSILDKNSNTPNN